MCDQLHFDEDLKDFEARGLVARKPLGPLRAGVSIMLPQVCQRGPAWVSLSLCTLSVVRLCRVFVAR